MVNIICLSVYSLLLIIHRKIVVEKSFKFLLLQFIFWIYLHFLFFWKCFYFLSLFLNISSAIFFFFQVSSPNIFCIHLNPYIFLPFYQFVFLKVFSPKLSKHFCICNTNLKITFLHHITFLSQAKYIIQNVYEKK